MRRTLYMLLTALCASATMYASPLRDAIREAMDKSLKMLDERVEQEREVFHKNLDREGERFRARVREIAQEERDRLAQRISYLIGKDVDSKAKL